MFRWTPVTYAACGVTTLIALTPLATYWQPGGEAGDEPLAATEGRVQLAIDEQDVGEADVDTSLEVCFLVANAGSERLLLRQVGSLAQTRAGNHHPLYTVSPGRTIAVMARLNSNELIERGRKLDAAARHVGMRRLGSDCGIHCNFVGRLADRHVVNRDQT